MGDEKCLSASPLCCRPLILLPSPNTCRSLFNILRLPLVVLPKAMRALSDALAAIEKIEIFLNTPTAVRQELSQTSTGINIVSPLMSSGVS